MPTTQAYLVLKGDRVPRNGKRAKVLLKVKLQRQGRLVVRRKWRVVHTDTPHPTTQYSAHTTHGRTPALVMPVEAQLGRLVRSAHNKGAKWQEGVRLLV